MGVVRRPIKHREKLYFPLVVCPDGLVAFYISCISSLGVHKSFSAILLSTATASLSIKLTIGARIPASYLECLSVILGQMPSYQRAIYFFSYYIFFWLSACLSEFSGRQTDTPEPILLSVKQDHPSQWEKWLFSPAQGAARRPSAAPNSRRQSFHVDDWFQKQQMKFHNPPPVLPLQLTLAPAVQEEKILWLLAPDRRIQPVFNGR